MGILKKIRQHLRRVYITLSREEEGILWAEVSFKQPPSSVDAMPSNIIEEDSNSEIYYSALDISYKEEPSKRVEGRLKGIRQNFQQTVSINHREASAAGEPRTINFPPLKAGERKEPIKLISENLLLRKADKPALYTKKADNYKPKSTAEGYKEGSTGGKFRSFSPFLKDLCEKDERANEDSEYIRHKRDNISSDMTSQSNRTDNYTSLSRHQAIDQKGEDEALGL